MPIHTGLTDYVSKLAEIRVVMDLIAGDPVTGLSALLDAQSGATFRYVRDSFDSAPSFYRGAARWFFLRQFISLQARLGVEHVLWNLGPPYSDLVTGFEPGTLTGEFLPPGTEEKPPRTDVGILPPLPPGEPPGKWYPGAAGPPKSSKREWGATSIRHGKRPLPRWFR